MSRLVVARDLATFRAALRHARSAGKRVGLVPTMGALHDGHLRLVGAARENGCEYVAASVFVNPTQFGPNEDFAKYPRDLDGDAKKLASAGTDLVLFPTVDEMYPKGETTRVRVGALGDTLCGPFRPGHFEGVATVVTKLFALAAPCTAVFGKKDYQQLQIVQRLAIDLLFEVTVLGVPTVREKDGLAMSSRNAYLSAEERTKALSLSSGLRDAQARFLAGERNAGKLRGAARAPVERVATSIDYVDVADPRSLRVYGDDETIPDQALVAVACRIGTTRLIDNVVLGEDAPIP